MPSETELLSRFAALARVIGNTPMLAIDFFFRGRLRAVYAKCEHLNLTGSIKDRMALHILRTAYVSGRLTPGDKIVEVTSGNTGISFAAIGTALGHPVTIFMPDWMSTERKQLIQSYGARVVSVSREEGGFIGAIRKTEEMASDESNVFLPRQFSNCANVEAHELTRGREIWLQLGNSDLVPGAFVAGVGTGGTVMGVGRFLRTARKDIRIHPVEPAESPTLSTGCKIGHHRIQGISDEFIPPILDLCQLDSVISISDGDSIVMAKTLAREIGLGVGISSGCNFSAATQIQNDLGGDAIVVTVFPDDNKKYLTTDLLRDEPVRDGFLSPQIKLTAIRVLPRVCQMCDALPTALRSYLS
ncbi:Cysteine synthase [Candidatus Sulfotelmatobacter kueseliae]|uniref:cysteine synthase n=1 Tax=Candidatus Sulfotelmatobacter kueseliae TaxID=2042962 RepID=A0A2U3KAG1_9BACT|nr:Cysteine synthase [Candidatus Sulfotelmatobacter kueseliae]